MTDIRLERGSWSFDPARRLGEKGGFGEVFRGTGADGAEVAIKRLNVSPADAHREVDMARDLAARDLEHVVPILDWGRDEETDAFYVVMPVCERSLADLISAEAPLSMSEARSIALQIVDGLLEVRDIVHRDLKPQNVLSRDGSWAIADFGIAKLVADATSLQTMRGALSPQYAAPEQWRGERPTPASDVYALGCIIHAMINGAPPFSGDEHDLREAHLGQQAPALSGGDPRLTSFVRLMLAKEPGSRPDLARCRDVISTVGSAAPVHPALQAAAGAIAAERARAEAASMRQRTEQQQRDALVRGAAADLDGIWSRLCAAVAVASDDATVSDRMLRFGGATLTRTRIEPVSVVLTHVEVAAWCAIELVQAAADGRNGLQRKFAATVALTRHAADGPFRWVESGYWSWSASGQRKEAPFALDPNSQEFSYVESNVMSGTQRAYGPFAIDGEDEDAFANRWIGLVGRASVGQLHMSGTLPLPPGWFERG